MGTIVVTDNLDDIAQILRDDVDMVVIRRPPSAEVKRAIKAFNVSSLDKKKFGSRGGRYIDGNRLFLSERDKETRKALAPLWKERRKLKNAFQKALGTKIKMTHLFIQPAIRKESRDYTFHRDYATGWSSEKERRENEIIFMTVAHKGYGTEVIPGKDAGRQTPYTKDNRASFHHPHSLKKLFRGATGDILVMKSGRNGTIHRSPHKGKGRRWWTFFSTGPIGKIPKKDT